MTPSSPEHRRSGLPRLLDAWSALQREQQAVAIAALVLIATMLLPWYAKSTTTATASGPVTKATSKEAITVFSFVEAAIFLVGIAVIVLMLARGERRAFHLPGGDGFIVSLAGAWATFLVFYRFIDQPNASSSNRIVVDYDLHWGIFFGLLAALGLLAAGLRLRGAHLTEPVLRGGVRPGDGRAPVPARGAAPAGAVATAGATAPADRAVRRAQREERRAATARGEDPWAAPPPAPPGAPGDETPDAGRAAPRRPAAPDRPRPQRDAAPTVVDRREPAEPTARRPTADDPDPGQLSFEDQPG